MLEGHQVVLGGDLRRVPEPLGDRVGRVPLHPVGFAGGPEVLEQPRPGLVASLRNNPFKGGRSHVGSSRSVEQVSEPEPADHAAPYPLGDRGQISLMQIAACSADSWPALN